jgi:hypothetical protein
MRQIENTIRDFLVNRLELIESGLKLLKKGQYLPNELGTRGFVDILAKDSSGRFVIIELKRSDSASREALHEVLKYIEGIKQNKKLKDDEIRAIVVSTKWNELLVPFSSFYNRCNCSVMGVRLTVDDDLKPISARKIVPLELKNDRLLSDQHMYRLYTSEDSLEKGIKSHIDCYHTKGISDYILVILKAPPGFQEREIAATIHGLKSMSDHYGLPESSISREKMEAMIPDYKFMIYSVFQVLEKNEYYKIISIDENMAKEVNEFAEGMEHEELMGALHEYTIATEPTPYNEHLGISYPAKFNAFIDNQGWKIKRIEKFGGFKQNELLTDEMVINELGGSSGTNRQKYKKDFDSSYRASFSQMKKDVKVCLADNLIWRQHILNFIDEIESLSEEHSFNGKLYIFNPSNTVHSIHLTTTSGDPLVWQPNYYLLIEGYGIKRMYFGGLVANGKTASMKEILETFYDGDAFQFHLPMTWGGYESRDYKIASYLGLEYSSFQVIDNEKGKVFLKYDGYEFHKCSPTDPFEGYLNFLDKNPKLIQEINKFFKEHTPAPGIFSC